MTIATDASTLFGVTEQFASRPTLHAVAASFLRAALLEEYPQLDIDPACVGVSTLASGAASNDPRMPAQSLLSSMLYHFLAQSTPAWSGHVLLRLDEPQAQLLPVDMTEISAIVDRVAQGLLVEFKQAVADFWSQPANEDSRGKSPTRWAWLSSYLRRHVLAQISAAAPDIPHAQRAAYDALARQPVDLGARIEVGVSYVSSDGQLAGASVPLPVLLVVSRGAGRSEVLAYRPFGDFEFSTLAEWEAKLRTDSSGADHAGLFRWALAGETNPYDLLAQAILELQLGAIKPSAAIGSDVDALDRYFYALTDVAAQLMPRKQRSIANQSDQGAFADWLRNAPDSDRLDYSRLMSALAVLQARTKGEAFDDGLPPIRVFAEQALRQAVVEDHPTAGDLSLGEVELIIDKVTAVATGSGGQMSALGGIEQVRMTLLDFALENLVGLPPGDITLHRANSAPLPDWLNVEYVKHLVRRVDIGGVYPALLHKLLISDPAESQRRRQLYCDQLRLQLPLKALEQMLKGQGGVSRQGWRMVASLMDPKMVAGQAVVVRQLGFIAHPDRKPDLVPNMFVIGPDNPGAGGHLLYQPFARTPLTEFSSWSALMAAVVAPGELQQQVLLWLSDNARAIYDNGGFQEPHIVRFGLGSDFAPLERPAPASLCTSTVVGDPLYALFQSNASTLVALADRSSVSNVENRWASFKEGGWLILNSLLPILGGAVGNSVWLLQLFDSARQFIELPTSANKQLRSAALADLLLNAAMLLLHQGISFKNTKGRPSPGADPEAHHVPQMDGVDQDAALEVHPLDIQRRQPELDFKWSSPLAQLDAAQRARLLALRALPEPSLRAASSESSHAGLYECRGHWYARLEGGVYRVMVDDDGVHIVSDDELMQVGPPLIRDASGWRLDFGLKLRGGGPKQNARDIARANIANTRRINDRLAELQLKCDGLVKITRALLMQLQTAQGEVRRLFIDRYESNLGELLEAVEERIRLGQEHRPGDRPPEKEVATELKSMARQVRYFEELLLEDLQRLASQDLAHMRSLVAIDAVVPENADAYFELFRKLTIGQAKGVHWAKIRAELWARLRQVAKVGETYWRDEVVETYAGGHPSLLEWNTVHMFSTLELVFSRPEIMFSAELNVLRALRNDDLLHAALASHAAVEKPNDYGLGECIGVVESALKEYDRASDVASYIYSLDFAGAKGQYLEQFVAQLNQIREDAMNRLTLLIRANADALQSQQDYLPKVAQPGRKVIRTRGQRTLIGQVRQTSSGGGEVVDVVDAVNNKVIQSWHEHADGDWAQMVEAGPPATPAIAAPPLAELKSQAKALLGRVDVSIKNAWQQSRRANEPADMEDILLQKAAKLTALADQIRPYSSEPALAPAIALELATSLQDLVGAAARLSAQGREIRIAMIKAQPPTAGRISYLHQQKEVNIASFDGRKNMSGSKRDDFLQEFTVRDKDNRILWWAHFHYAAEDARADAYTAAHLKLPAQRFMGYKALVRAAQANSEVVSIYRSSISADVAKRLFLVLTP
jgi:hypothetical protein